MTKKDALRLRPGDRVVFGPSAQVAKCIGLTEEGEVQHVTKKGGLLVSVMRGHEPARTYDEPKWIRYSHVIRVSYKVPRTRKQDEIDDILSRKWSDL